MSREIIVIAEASGYDETALALYRTQGQVVTGVQDRRNLLDRIAEATVVVVRLGYHIDREILDAAPNLRAIVSPTTGVNHIDVNLARERGISVLSMRGETDFLDEISATAELTWGLILALVRSIPAAHNHAQEGGWDRDRFIGQQLRGKTLGIIGLGRIGRMVAGYGHAFHMKVLAADPSPVRTPMEYVQMLPHRDLYAQADIVTLHVPCQDTTLGLVDEGSFSAMRPGAYFVNTSRGELVNEAALLAALESGRITGAALDVLDGEPETNRDWPKNHRLLTYACRNQNLIITPHIGGAAIDALRQTEAFMARKLIALNSSVGAYTSFSER